MLPRSLSAACHMAGSKPRLAPFLAVFFSCFFRAMPGPTPVDFDGLSCAMIFYQWLLVKKRMGPGKARKQKLENGKERIEKKKQIPPDKSRDSRTSSGTRRCARDDRKRRSALTEKSGDPVPGGQKRCRRNA